MVKYELARYKKQNGQICASSIAEITENQYKQICNCFSFVDFYHTCKCLKLLVVENEKNLSKYFVDLKTEKRSYSELELEKLVTQADFLLINYLSSVNTFIDVMSNLISKKNLSNLDEFKKLDS